MKELESISCDNSLSSFNNVESGELLLDNIEQLTNISSEIVELEDKLDNNFKLLKKDQSHLGYADYLTDPNLQISVDPTMDELKSAYMIKSQRERLLSSLVFNKLRGQSFMIEAIDPDTRPIQEYRYNRFYKEFRLNNSLEKVEAKLGSFFMNSYSPTLEFYKSKKEIDKARTIYYVRPFERYLGRTVNIHQI